MREVFEYYGRFLLEGIGLAALLSMIWGGMKYESGNQGLCAIVGAQIEMEMVDYRSYTDFKTVYKRESEKAPPHIYFEGEGLEIGSHVLFNYIKALDSEGQNIGVVINSIKGPNEVELIEGYNPYTGEITFSKPGVYVISVYAKDRSNKRTEAIIKIPMNQRKRSI